MRHQNRKFGSNNRLLLLLCSLSALPGCLSPQDDGDPLPTLENFPIAYIKRAVTDADLPGANQNNDIRNLTGFPAPADIYLRDSASPSAKERNITFSFTHGEGYVKDLVSSPDGDKLLFSMRAAEIPDVNDDEQPTWNLWQYDLNSATLERVIVSDLTAEAGHDVNPAYLADGRILFASTRQRRSGAILLDEGKPRFQALNEDRNATALMLHTINPANGEIRQVTFNPSLDMTPALLSSGAVVFSRWDNMGSTNNISLYRMQPDGSGEELLYGAHSHDDAPNPAPRQFIEPQELPDGRLLVKISPYNYSNENGRYVTIATDNYVDRHHPTYTRLASPEEDAEQPFFNPDLEPDNLLSPLGQLRAVSPIWDGSPRFLIAWSPCRLIEEEQVNGETVSSIRPCTAERLAAADPQPAPPLVGIYMYNEAERTQLPLVLPQEGYIYDEPVALQTRTIIYPAADLNPTYVDEGVGVLHIRSVYDLDGLDSADPDIAILADPSQTAADQRPARFLRLVKGVSVPPTDLLVVPGTAYGRSQQQLMREIIGYAPIEPDGSVMVKVPANIPLAVSVLDAQGRRITPRHEHWLQLRPGETKECNGCHDHAAAIPHGRREGPPSAYAGAPTAAPFPNTEPLLTAEMGETMAQTRARHQGVEAPGVDLVYEDHWTAAPQPKTAPFAYRYADLATPAPASPDCQTLWHSLCRVVIHYPDHIHPLWSRPRPVLDGMGVEIDNHTCTNCHNDQDSGSLAQVPAAQLDLIDGPSDQQANHLKSYRELLFGDNEQELVDGVLQDRLVQAVDGNGEPLFEVDLNGQLILDGFGNPIPIMVTVPAQGPSMSVQGAHARYFLSKFDSGGSHEGWLDEAEKRLIAEWLDIGGQYYNDPFAVP